MEDRTSRVMWLLIVALLVAGALSFGVFSSELQADGSAFSATRAEVKEAFEAGDFNSAENILESSRSITTPEANIERAVLLLEAQRLRASD